MGILSRQSIGQDHRPPACGQILLVETENMLEVLFQRLALALKKQGAPILAAFAIPNGQFPSLKIPQAQCLHQA